VLRQQTTWRREAVLWFLCLAMASLLVAPLIVHGIAEVGAQLTISTVESLHIPLMINVSSQAEQASPAEILGQADLDLNRLSRANSIDEADNARWSLVRRTLAAARVYQQESGVDWNVLRGLNQTGTILIPAGFTWSFNETFQQGPGYKEAGGILAGGHCALATVFRAAAMQAGLPTIARPHAWSIPGFPQNQTVNIYWGRDDLLVRNTTGQDLYFVWSVLPDSLEVSLTPVSVENPLVPLPTLDNKTIAMIYGRPEPGGWGSLGQTAIADQAIYLARTYAERLDEWNGDKAVVVAIDPNAAMAGKVTSRDTYLYYLIAEARRESYYVMLDVQTGDRDPLALFNAQMDKFLYENVWFDWDLEHTAGGMVRAEQINQVAQAYFDRRRSMGYSSPGIFGFYVFKTDQIVNPDKLCLDYDGGLVVPIFDGFGGRGSDPAGSKISKTIRVLSQFGEGSFGVMEFETRWGNRYDQISAREYFAAFPEALIMASQ
jgi:hypothetical protein